MHCKTVHFVLTLGGLVVALFMVFSPAAAPAKDWCTDPSTLGDALLGQGEPAILTAFSQDLIRSEGIQGHGETRLNDLGQTLCILSNANDHDRGATGLSSARVHALKTKPIHHQSPPRVQNDPLIEAPMNGFAYPMENMKTIRGFDGAKCRHQGLDIYGDDEYYGTGKPIYAITRSSVIFIGTPEKNRGAYGRRDRRGGAVKRGKVTIPRRMTVEGYGEIYPFTRTLGRARTGVFLVTKSLNPDYPDHLVRYMHLSAIHPEIKVGDIVEAGQEVGLMGSTAVMKSIPHLHLDMETAKGLRVNAAPLIGLKNILPSRCKALTRAQLIRLKRRHVVRRGDSLWKIARKYKTTVGKLKRLNRLRRGLIKPGQKLRVR